MLRTHYRFFRLIFQVCDALVVLMAWSLAYWIRFESGWSFIPASFDDAVDFRSYSIVGIVMMFVWFLSLQISGAYKSWRTSSFAKEIFSLFQASLIAFLILVAGLFFFAREDYSRISLGIFLLLNIFGLILERSFLRSFLQRMRKKGFNQRHIVFVGDEGVAKGIVKRLQARKELGLNVVGLVSMGTKPQELKDLGSLDSLDELLKASNIDQVVVCLKNKDALVLDQVLSIASENNVQVRIVPDIGSYAILGFEVEVFDGVPIISMNSSPLVGWNSVLKRMTDIAYALVALMVFSIPMFAIALIIKLTSRGPLFYTQERMGLDGRLFHMIKFRSMQTNAEEKSGAVWAKENDARVTWIGGILRKTSLDELPQLFNVLKGDMSCVGPRPERPVFVDKFRKEVPGYMLRHKVKAGMTGWAQINGFRGDTSLEGRIQYDLYYITHWSLGFDFKIMFLTIFKGFIAPNAY